MNNSLFTIHTIHKLEEDLWFAVEFFADEFLVLL
jgi:hypothetical protein